jgi:hypothetical protein
MMIADWAVAGSYGPRKCWRGGRGPNEWCGLTEAFTMDGWMDTMVILNKSGKEVLKHEGLQFRI